MLTSSALLVEYRNNLMLNLTTTFINLTVSWTAFSLFNKILNTVSVFSWRWHLHGPERISFFFFKSSTCRIHNFSVPNGNWTAYFQNSLIEL